MKAGLALGFIIGTAFAGLVDSLASDVITQFVAIDATKCRFCTADIEPGVLDNGEIFSISFAAPSSRTSRSICSPSG